MTHKETKFKYPSLNGLRAISIIFVIFGHLDGQYHILEHGLRHELLKPLVAFIKDSQLGVNVFFVISGFLITSLLLTEERKTGTVSFKNFYIRRTLRIFPAYYFYLLVMLVLQLLSIIDLSNISWITSLTYTKYIDRGHGAEWFTAHSWTLSIEEQFYLFWPLLFTFGDKTRKRVAFSLLIAIPLIRLWLYYHPVQLINLLMLSERLDELAVGCLIALYKDELLNIAKPHFQTLFYLSMIGIVSLQLFPLINIQYHHHLNLDPLMALFGFCRGINTNGILASFFIGIILLYSVFGHQGLWFRLLNSKVLNYIGLLSYSIYLWQQIFISPLKYWVTSFPQNLLFVFVAALFSYYCIEQPFLKLKDRFQKT